jgi:cytoskeletal protein RodZ
MKEDPTVLGLANIRKNRGISLEQIAAVTKISVRSLQAIELGDFRKLPGGIYNTSYIRQYARAIDYDESILLAYYANAMAVTDGNAQRSVTGGNGGYGGFRPASTTVGS